ncbi:DUF4097 family beta strand repeat-containing protein [Streptomyces fulvorobeus]|uniref:Lipoprotein n=1 Tax=Streptomyces fulvorobeus TaxID=284028 RepID=A0A7J0C2W7_9ACTN|nr:DUF4097 family beta strand repeat-containing protein [Streptomyces fulvorobeus]NYE40550.1 hypothetical protein [Streptomyces fulvorobeus]GFM96842.1 lipoprotein [Streptomyces fulvorobeus]
MTLRTRTLTGALGVSGGVLVLLTVLSGCGSTDVDDAPAERKSFALSGKALTIDSENSTVELVPADVRQVEVTRRFDGWVVLGSGPEAVWEMDGGVLRLEVKCEAMISDCAAHHRVRVPRGVAVAVRGDNGKVTASGFDTRLDLTSHNGGVVVRDSSGPLKLGSDNGAVVAERISAASVNAHSDNGSVRLEFTGVPTLVETVSDNGSIFVELPGGEEAYAVNAEAVHGDVSVKVPRREDSPHVVRARSDNGEITVRSAN